MVAEDLRAYGSREQAEVIGFRASASLLVEVRCSRHDFVADFRKPERTAGGLGVNRVYLCPGGLRHADEIRRARGCGGQNAAISSRPTILPVPMPTGRRS